MPAAKKKTAHERVLEFVEAELKKNPKIKSAELLERAKKVSRTVAGMTVRQFHAKYPLQVKRRSAPKRPRKQPSRARSAPRGPKRRAGQVDRDAIRTVLLGFAKDLSAAESQAATIELMANLDRYVDRVAKAAA